MTLTSSTEFSSCFNGISILLRIESVFWFKMQHIWPCMGWMLPSNHGYWQPMCQEHQPSTDSSQMKTETGTAASGMCAKGFFSFPNPHTHSWYLACFLSNPIFECVILGLSFQVNNTLRLRLASEGSQETNRAIVGKLQNHILQHIPA